MHVLQIRERLTVDTSDVTHVAIPIDAMPALRAYSASCTARPVVDGGRAGADDIRKVDGMVVGRLEVGSRHERKPEVALVAKLEGSNRG